MDVLEGDVECTEEAETELGAGGGELLEGGRENGWRERWCGAYDGVSINGAGWLLRFLGLSRSMGVFANELRGRRR